MSNNERVYSEGTEKKQKEQEQLYRREQRRKRRQRAQMTAYVTVVIFLAIIAMGVVLGVHALTKHSAGQEQQQQEQQNKVDQLLATEESLEVPDPSEVVVELTDEQKLDEIVNAGIEVMPLEDKVAGLFIVTPESITGVSTAVKAGEGTQKALNEYSVGGIVYSGKNMRSEEQLKEMLSNTNLYASYPLFLAVEEEGGTISPVTAAGLGTKVDAAETIGENGDVNKAYEAGTTIGTYLSDLGFNLNFAPVADLNNVENSAIDDRSYGTDATAVSEYVMEMSEGMEAEGVTSCLKHFPGIGSTTQDTHNGLATSERTAEEFRAEELKVFQAGIDGGADMIMVGHMAAPALSGDNTPCSMSETVVTDILREEMGFKGVIISDAMNQKAISEYYGADEAAVLALRAGCDMILMPEDFEKAYNGVLQAVADGTISEERINDSLRRIYRIKYADKVE